MEDDIRLVTAVENIATLARIREETERCLDVFVDSLTGDYSRCANIVIGYMTTLCGLDNVIEKLERTSVE